jgi:predicted RNase H-like nuclease (RuvC/YqgF family)
MNASKLRESIKALEQSIDTVKYQIDHLSNHYSPLQVTMWRKYIAKLRKELKEKKQQLKTLPNEKVNYQTSFTSQL